MFGVLHTMEFLEDMDVQNVRGTRDIPNLIIKNLQLVMDLFGLEHSHQILIPQQSGDVKSAMFGIQHTTISILEMDAPSAPKGFLCPRPTTENLQPRGDSFGLGRFFLQL